MARKPVVVGLPDRQISQLYVWLAIDQEGNEGIIAAPVPLVTSNKEMAETQLAEAARRTQQAGKAAGHTFRIELRTFKPELAS